MGKKAATGKKSSTSKKGPTPYTFKPGFVQDRDTARVIAQNDAIADAGEPDSKALKWVRQTDAWATFGVEWMAIRMWVVTKPKLEVFVLGDGGEICVADLQGIKEEHIDESDEGPINRGPMRELRWIGDHLYAAGMARQVYRREAPRRWTRRDTGTVLPLGTVAVAGFNALDGLSESDFFGVGFNGEIWRCVKGKWRQLESPTNVVLTRVRVVGPEEMYACGQQGVLLRGTGDTWTPIEHEETEDDLWGMEWYDDALYVASDEDLYRLGPGDTLDRVDMKLGKRRTCSHLHANDGVMWSFGPKHLSWTEDAKTWHDATP